jgi:hypothetical protein
MSSVNADQPVHSTRAGRVEVDVEKDAGRFSEVLKVIRHCVGAAIPNLVIVGIYPGIVDLGFIHKIDGRRHARLVWYLYQLPVIRAVWQCILMHCVGEFVHQYAVHIAIRIVGEAHVIAVHTRRPLASNSGK